MAAGDLNGDLKDAYLTPDERAARMVGRSQANQSSGPVGRATQQLAAQPVSLGQIGALPASQAAPAASLAAIGGPGSAAQSPAQAVPVQAQSPSPASLADIAATRPAATIQPQSLTLDQFRPISSIAGAASQPIVGRVGQNGVAEFSNQPADLRRGLGAAPVSGAAAPASLNDVPVNARVSAGSIASLGSIGNLGDGVGTFSQGSRGDAANAMNIYRRAEAERQAGRDNARLNLANARLAQDQNFTVVSDSSRAPTLASIRGEQQRQATTQGLQNAVLSAQDQIGTRRQGLAADQQLRQASRLEDLSARAYAPNATAEDREALLRAQDPTGEKALARQLTAANISKTQAEANKTNSEANSPLKQQQAQLNQQEIAKRDADAATAARDRTTQKTSALDNAKDALKLVSEVGSSKQLNDITGPINSRLPTVSGDSQDLINKALRLQTLLTADNLKMMTGVLTDRDISFLAQIGSGLGVSDGGISGSTAGTRQRLGEITTRLGEKIASYEGGNSQGGQAAATSTSPASSAAPAAQSLRVGEVRQGYTYLGGDPAQQSSWRVQ